MLGMRESTDESRSLGPNIVHSIDGMIVREMHRRCDFDRGHIIELIERIMHSDYTRSPRMDRDKDHVVKLLWDRYAESGFLSARILDDLGRDNLASIDYSMILKLLRSMPETPFRVMSIHDCFRCLPNHGNELRRQYNQILSEIADSDLLSFIASQIEGYKVTVTKMGDISSQILEADYAIS